MVATPQPNPRRRPMILPTPPPPGRGAGIMTLPQRKPTAVERKMANRLSVVEQFQNRRPMNEVLAEGRDVLEGLGTGAIAGLAGLPADLTGIIFGDVPAVINKLVTGETINQEESPYFQQLNEFRRTYGAEGIMRLMGVGDRLDAPAEGDDALSRAGINRFKQSAFVGEFLLDPFALAKAPKALKALRLPSDSEVAAYDRQLAGAQADAQQRMGTDEEMLEFFDELTGQEQQRLQLTDPNRTLDVQPGQTQLQALEEAQAEEGLIDSVDDQFTFAPNTTQELIDSLNGPDVVSINPDIIPGGPAGGDGVTVFNYVPGLSDADLTTGTRAERPFSYYEFSEDMFDLTGRRIPEGTRIAWPEQLRDDFFSFFHNSPPRSQPTGEVVAPEVRASAVPTPPSATAAEELIEGTATEIVSDTPQAGFTGVVDTPLIPTNRLMPATASPDTQVARHSVMTRSVDRQGDVVDYSPFYQLIDRLPDNRAMSKEEVLDSLRGGFAESVNRDREGSKFVEFLEKHAPNQLYRGQVMAMYRDYTPQLRVKTLTQTELDEAAAQGISAPVGSLVDYGQNSVPSSAGGETMHIYLNNPNSTIPFTDGTTVQTRGGTGSGYQMRDGLVADHSIGASGGPGTSTATESGVPGYFGHIRLEIITDDQGRKIGVLQEMQSNAAVAERKFAKGQDTSFNFLTGEERYNIDELRSTPEGLAIFDEAANSRVLEPDLAAAQLDTLGSLRQDATERMGNDLQLIGGPAPSADETFETLEAIYDNAPTGVPTGLDLTADLIPMQRAVAKLVTSDLLNHARGAGRTNNSRTGVDTTLREFTIGHTGATEFGPSSKRAINLADLLKQKHTYQRHEDLLDAEDIATLNRVLKKRASQHATTDWSTQGRPQSVTDDAAGPITGEDRITQIYRDMNQAAENGEEPLDFLSAPGLDREFNADNIIKHDPGLFGFLTEAFDDVPMQSTHESVPAMAGRNMQHRIMNDVADALEAEVPTRTPEDVSKQDMDDYIDGLGVSEERKEELMRTFERWITTVNNPNAPQAYRPGSPFSGKKSDVYFNQFAPRLILAEARKKGLDGVIFPNWEDMHDVGGRPSREIVKEIYDSHIKKGLAQAVGSENVVEIPTIKVGQEDLLHKQTGRPHRSARAVYFGDGPLGEAFDDKLIRRAKGGPVDLRPKKLVHSGIGAMARQVM
mgnify:CR=1 FL=1